jgi:hypothetical protein
MRLYCGVIKNPIGRCQLCKEVTNLAEIKTAWSVGWIAVVGWGLSGEDEFLFL